jgi:uncharacterized DUF497 family protein
MHPEHPELTTKFVWDPVKAQINLRKHGISFETASLVFDDPNALSRQDRIENGEERWQTIGMVHGIAILVVAHTEPILVCDRHEEYIRIISARPATKKERGIYVNGYF